MKANAPTPSPAAVEPVLPFGETVLGRGLAQLGRGAIALLRRITRPPM